MCAPVILDQSAVLVKMMTVMHVVALEWTLMLLEQYAVLVGSSHFLGFL